jgi:hypothetical protein
LGTENIVWRWLPYIWGEVSLDENSRKMKKKVMGETENEV